MEKTFKVKKTNRNLNPFVIFLLVMLILYSAIFSFLIIFGTINSFKPYLQYDRELDYLGLPNYDNPLYTQANMKGKPVYFPHAFYNYEKVLKRFLLRKANRLLDTTQALILTILCLSIKTTRILLS